MRGFMAFVGCLLAVALMVGVLIVSYSNREVRLRNQAAAQEVSNQATFDNVWKTIAQQGEVSEAYKDQFKEVWKDIVEGQSTAGRNSAVLAFVSRFSPKFSPDLMKKLMTTIESQRKEFLGGQQKLIDIKREHDNIRTTFPAALVCGTRPELHITVVTSAKTSDAFESGKEDDVGVFKKKEQLLRPKQ